MKLIISIILLAMSSIAIAEELSHGGRTDKSGCHNDRKYGDYHCH